MTIHSQMSHVQDKHKKKDTNPEVPPMRNFTPFGTVF